MLSQQTTRRVFMLQIAAAGAAVGAAAQAATATAPDKSKAASKAAPAAKAAAAPAAAVVAANLVSEKDANAVALGYVADAKKVDAKKWPKYAAGQNCSNCALYKGDAKSGDCALFAGKKVAAAAWCSAYAKKA